MTPTKLELPIKIGYTLALATLLMSAWHFIDFLLNTPMFMREPTKIVLYVLLFAASLGLIALNIANTKNNILRLIKFYQFFMIYLTGVVLVSQRINLSIGSPLILFSIILLLRYKLLTGFRFLLIIIFTIISIELSQFINKGVLFESISFSLFIVVSFAAIYIVFQEELLNAEEREKKLKKENRKLKKENIQLNTSLSDLKPKSISLDSINLTSTEKRVLTTLCQTKGTNQEIAKAMKVKEITIKVHISNILKKSGLNKRWDLINCFSSVTK